LSQGLWGKKLGQAK